MVAFRFRARRAPAPSSEERKQDLNLALAEFEDLPPTPIQVGRHWIALYRDEYEEVYGQRPPLSQLIHLRKQAMRAYEDYLDNQNRRVEVWVRGGVLLGASIAFVVALRLFDAIPSGM